MRREKWYGVVRWAIEDIIAVAEENGITLTEEQAEKWWKKNEQSFMNTMAEYGNEVLSSMDLNISSL